MCDLRPWCVTLSKPLNLSGPLIPHVHTVKAKVSRLLRSLPVLWLGVKITSERKYHLLLFLCLSSWWTVMAKLYPRSLKASSEISWFYTLLVTWVYFFSDYRFSLRNVDFGHPNKSNSCEVFILQAWLRVEKYYLMPSLLYFPLPSPELPFLSGKIERNNFIAT